MKYLKFHLFQFLSSPVSYRPLTEPPPQGISGTLWQGSERLRCGRSLCFRDPLNFIRLQKTLDCLKALFS